MVGVLAIIIGGTQIAFRHRLARFNARRSRARYGDRFPGAGSGLEQRLSITGALAGAIILVLGVLLLAGVLHLRHHH